MSASAIGCAVGEGSGGPAPWSIPAEEGDEKGDVDIDPHGSDESTTSGDPKGSSSMNPPPPATDGDSGEASTSEEPATSTSGLPPHDGSSSSGDDEMPPPGDPLWSFCNEDADCESEICLFVIDGETMEPKSAYCSEPCETPQSDCPPPPTGNASPECLSTTTGESLCALDCSLGQSCPFGMECMQITAVASYCF